MSEQGPESTHGNEPGAPEDAGENPLAAAESRRLGSDAPSRESEDSHDTQERDTEQGQKSAAAEQDASEAGLEEDPA